VCLLRLSDLSSTPQEYLLLHPVVSKREKKLKKQQQKVQERQRQQESAADSNEVQCCPCSETLLHHSTSTHTHMHT